MPRRTTRIADHGNSAVAEHPAQRARVGAVQAVERRVISAPRPFAALLRARLEPVEAEQRRHRARDEEAHDQRERDRQRQRHEEVLRDAGQEQHREEHDDGRDGRHQDGHRDLLRRSEHRLPAICPKREVPVDVLELDDRVVDQPPDAERQPAQREDVQASGR